jgi:hypothetical protein
MSVRVARESDGRVSITVAVARSNTAIVSAVEARLLAIKLLLAAEQLEPAVAGR